MKEIDLDNLPKRGKFIDWKNTIGCKCKFVYDDIEGEVEIVGYEKENTTLNIKFDKKEYELKAGMFTRCQFGKILGKHTSDFKIEIGTRFKDYKRDLVITDREYRKDKRGDNRKWYKYTCNNCGWTEGWIEESLLLNRHTVCSCCSSKTVVPGINDIPTTAPWMTKYFQGGEDEAKLYTKSSCKKIYPICPDCGRIKDKLVMINNIYRVNSIGCSCSDGKPYDEKLFYHIVNEQLGLNMLWGANKNDYPWMGKYIYDFVDEENKIIWELDGGLGHGNKVHSRCYKTLKETIEGDKYKDELAKNNGYKVIRINTHYGNNDRLNYIKNSILVSELIKINNLHNINWNNAHEFALKNLVKEICKYYKCNPELMLKEIAKEFKLSYVTLIKYLKQGNELGWCNYTSSHNYSKLKVMCVELNEIFDSASECAIQLSKRFNKKFRQGNIIMVCNGKIKSHQGFHFKYISYDN